MHNLMLITLFQLSAMQNLCSTLVCLFLSVPLLPCVVLVWNLLGYDTLHNIILH